MPHVETDRLIAAPPDAVWSVLTDRERLLSGDFGLTRLDGRLEEGGTIVLETEATGSRAFRLRVTALEPPRRMVWRGGLPLGLFTGTRTFTLTPEGAGTRFAMREVFTGAMARIIFGSMPDQTPAFERFAAALARDAEG